jgi:hypothetical protein
MDLAETRLIERRFLEKLKREVLQKLANGRTVEWLPKHKVRIDNYVVHTRCCTGSEKQRSYSFGLNPNTLTANVELWICGSAERFYTIPTEVLHAIYLDGHTYPDRTHPKIRTVAIYLRTHECKYGRTRSVNFAAYYQRPL